MKKIIIGFTVILAITLLFVMGVSLYSGIDIIAKLKPIYDTASQKMVPNYWLAYEGNEVLVGGQVDAIMQNPYMLLTTNFMFNSSLPVFSLVLARLVLDALILYREKLLPQQVSFESKALTFISEVKAKANANGEKISIEKLVEELSNNKQKEKPNE